MLKDMLEKRGMSQSDLAKILEIDRSNISRWVNDYKAFKTISIEKLLTLCEILECKAENLIQEYGQNELIFDNNMFVKECKQLVDMHIEEIKNNEIFTSDELKFFADILNGMLFEYNGQFTIKSLLKMQVLDSEEYDGTATKWNVDQNELVKKLNKLSEFHCYSLVYTIKKWWKKEDRDLDNIL